MSNHCKPVLLGFRVALLAAAICAPVFLALASPSRLSAFFADRSALISARFGSLSLRFSANNTVRGDSTAVLALGERSSRDLGRWWVRASSICIQWETWFHARPRCFAIDLQDESAFTWRGADGEHGEGRLLDQGVTQ
jgi:hypothetical protein